MEDLEALMQERPDGVAPSAEDPALLDGFTIVGGNAWGDAGIVSHRTVLHEDEYVDAETLADQIEQEFGYTTEEVAAVYRQGPKTATQREFRTHIDARLLALSLSGASMVAVGKALGLTEKTIERALARARELHVEPQVPTGVVVTKRVCFKCGEPGATPRKRQYVGTPSTLIPPAHLRGTIDLCDPCYRQRFVVEEQKAARQRELTHRPPVTAADAARSRERMRELLRSGR